MSTGIKFDWTVSLSTVISIVMGICALSVLFYRMSSLEAEVLQVKMRLEQFAKENNEAHLAIVTAATRVGTMLDMHMKEVGK